VARLFADENMPLAVVETLRSLGHDVVTLIASTLGSGASDVEVLARGRIEDRAILTLDRRDFFRLHREQPEHAGIIACTFDPDFEGQAGRIHAALPAHASLRGVLLRVNRPSR
jgi:predicted nuclease of predicted toxin-antitoxin system